MPQEGFEQVTGVAGVPEESLWPVTTLKYQVGEQLVLTRVRTRDYISYIRLQFFFKLVLFIFMKL